MQIIMRIEVGYQPWAPSKLLSAAMEAERLLAEQVALQAALRPAAAPEAGEAAEEVRQQNAFCWWKHACSTGMACTHCLGTAIA